MKIQSKCHEILELYRLFSEPGLLDELARRVEEAERKFQAADLDLRLKELDAAKQRQVNPEPVPMDNCSMIHLTLDSLYSEANAT